MNKKIGYARVSTYDQNLDMQISALRDAGCDIIYSEKQSSSKRLKELENAFKCLKPGDTFVVWKLDRLGRNLKGLLRDMELFKSRKIEFLSIVDRLDTSTPIGVFFFQIMGCLAEYEREMISERTKRGLVEAKARGRMGGRPKGVNKETLKKVREIVPEYRKGQYKIKELCIMLSISRPTFFKALRELGVKLRKEN